MLDGCSHKASMCFCSWGSTDNWPTTPVVGFPTLQKLYTSISIHRIGTARVSELPSPLAGNPKMTTRPHVQHVSMSFSLSNVFNHIVYLTPCMVRTFLDVAGIPGMQGRCIAPQCPPTTVSKQCELDEAFKPFQERWVQLLHNNACGPTSSCIQHQGVAQRRGHEGFCNAHACSWQPLCARICFRSEHATWVVSIAL